MAVAMAVVSDPVFTVARVPAVVPRCVPASGLPRVTVLVLLRFLAFAVACFPALVVIPPFLAFVIPRVPVVAIIPGIPVLVIPVLPRAPVKVLAPGPVRVFILFPIVATLLPITAVRPRRAVAARSTRAGVGRPIPVVARAAGVKPRRTRPFRAISRNGGREWRNRRHRRRFGIRADSRHAVPAHGPRRPRPCRPGHPGPGSGGPLGRPSRFPSVPAGAGGTK